MTAHSLQISDLWTLTLAWCLLLIFTHLLEILSVWYRCSFGFKDELSRCWWPKVKAIVTPYSREHRKAFRIFFKFGTNGYLQRAFVTPLPVDLMGLCFGKTLYGSDLWETKSLLILFELRLVWLEDDILDWRTSYMWFMTRFKQNQYIQYIFVSLYSPPYKDVLWLGDDLRINWLEFGCQRSEVKLTVTPQYTSRRNSRIHSYDQICHTNVLYDRMMKLWHLIWGQMHCDIIIIIQRHSSRTATWLGCTETDNFNVVILVLTSYRLKKIIAINQ